MLCLHKRERELAKAMEMVFARDGGYASGFETLVGPKDVSGAIAAAAAARMFVRQPELLVLTTLQRSGCRD